LGKVVRHLLDLLNFCPGDVVVMDARADTHGTVQRLGHALGHALGKGVFPVTGQGQQAGFYLSDLLRLIGLTNLTSLTNLASPTWQRGRISLLRMPIVGRGKGHSSYMAGPAAAKHLQVAPLTKYPQVEVQAALAGGKLHTGSCCVDARWCFSVVQNFLPALCSGQTAHNQGGTVVI
jgi:hypothetical protein